MKKVYLIILDGFGIGDGGEGDAVARAKAPFWKKLIHHYPMTQLKTHGRCVGLPEFQMGGSEVGHLTIGAGRSIQQLLTTINDDIESGAFFEKTVVKDLFQRAQEKGKIHFVGMASDGGIHSFLPHLLGLLKMAKTYEIPNIHIHAFLDGRDVPERTARKYLSDIEAVGVGTLVSLGGRYYSMDRDCNWDRTEPEYRVMCDPDAAQSDQSWSAYLDEFYSSTKSSDYYIPPILLRKEGQIQKDDTVICFNFRADRMRQIMAALCDEDFSEFARPFQLDPSQVGVFGNYYDRAQVIYSLTHERIGNTLGELVSAAEGDQLRIAESDKCPHVTFFFSGETKDKFPGEEHIIVPSPKCPIYSEKPEMSAAQHTEKALEALKTKDYQLVVHNYGNGDLVGHSGDLPASIKAVETIDECLSRLVPAAREKGYTVVITADHGNCDEMLYEDGSPCPSHSKNLVPFLLLTEWGKDVRLQEEGTLADVAPTVLECLEMEAPPEMTGKSLIVH